MNLYDSRILIVDDEKALSRMVEGVSRKEGFINIYTAADCKSAELLTAENEFQMILLDVMLPDGDGFSLYEVMKEKEKNRNTPVIFLSARDEDYARLKGLGLGADDYVTKPFLPEELILRVKAVLKRTYHMEETMKNEQIGAAQVDWNAGVIRNGAEEYALTAKEYTLLRKLSENRGRILSMNVLCDTLWPDGSYGYENSLMVHIRRLREKIEKVIQYFVLFFCMMILLLVLNVVFIGVVEVQTSDEQSYPKAEKMAEYLQWDENGKCAMTKEGTDIVDLYQGFAMVIDNTGKIIWEYKLPEELEQTYTIQEVAVFAKWYLKDYPVDIHVVPNGILVLGRPKDTIWKYNISHSLGTMEALLKYIPYLLLVDILLLIVIPFIILRRQNRQKEKERTTWIAGVSHNIRTPLSLVLGYADEIGRESFDQEAVQKAQVIEEQAIRIRSLITNLNTENKLAYGMGNW